MRHKLVIGAGALVVALTATLLVLETDAHACGGCFSPPPPPTESPTVVTDHRMILSVSKDQSTLYDQIRYQGSPQSFAWVLPISGTVDVGLSADIVFSGLSALTSTVIQAPPLNCPPQPTACNTRNAQGVPSNASAGGDFNAGSGGVTVLKQEIVGPYETVQLQATDPTALHKWLAKHGFVVPEEVTPVIDKYVAEKFNFLALKLVPGKGVQEMRPVAVTTKGASAVLPLRMVAAGTGPTVGIGLWILSEGRYEPQNFKSFYIKTDDLVWDWTSQKSNYIDLRAQKTTENGGRVWEIESSLPLARQSIEDYVRNGFINNGNTGGGGFNGGGGGGAGASAPSQNYPYYPQSAEERAALYYLATKDEQGNVIKTASQARDEDMATLFYGIDSTSTRITRLRADLTRAALDVDLVVSASTDQGALPNVRQVTRELNQPLCPVWNGCTQNGQAPRDEAYARSTPANADVGGSVGGDGCSTTPKSENSTPAWPAWIGVGLGLVGLVIAKRLHQRRV